MKIKDLIENTGRRQRFDPPAGKLYKFADGEFYFYTATYGSWARDKRIVFRVRKDNIPEKRAEEKGIKYYDRLLQSTPDEIERWLKFKYPNYQPIKELTEEIDENEIKTLLWKYFSMQPTPYVFIDNDGLVNMQHGCELKDRFQIRKLPIKFGTVDAHFYCKDNALITLEGCPKVVKDSFDCTGNHLTSLVGGPEIVDGNYSCRHNQLTSLEGFPTSLYGDFYCTWTPFIPLLRTVQTGGEVVIEELDKKVQRVGAIINQCKKENPGSYRKAAIDARRKLIDAGFEGNAKW
jgi:hypothetical protein